MRTFFGGKSQGGFTIFELVVVIGIIGLMTAIVLASATQSRKSAKIKAEKASIALFESGIELYGQKVGAYPPGSTSLIYNSNLDGDNCSRCFMINGDTSSAYTEWKAAIDAMLSEGTIPQEKYYDEWGNVYAYDNNAGTAPNNNYWSIICSFGPNGENDTSSSDFLITDPNPQAQGDDICAFLKP